MGYKEPNQEELDADEKMSGLREEIANLICFGHSHPSCSPCSVAQSEAALVVQHFDELARKQGYVKLDDDQSLPAPSMPNEAGIFYTGYSQARIDMLKANFRKMRSK